MDDAIQDRVGERRVVEIVVPAVHGQLTGDDRGLARGAVIYRSRLHKTLKRNFQVMPGADWLALLCRHIPDRFEHLVRYTGWYSNRTRGKRRRMGADAPGVAVEEADVPTASRARSTWARLIHKVYEVDPLECPKCKGRLRPICQDRP